MKDRVKILRKLNDKSVEFSYKGVVFGWTIERLNKTTEQELDKLVDEANNKYEHLKEDIEKYRKEYNNMSEKQKESIDGFFERWNEYDEND